MFSNLNDINKRFSNTSLFSKTSHLHMRRCFWFLESSWSCTQPQCIIQHDFRWHVCWILIDFFEWLYHKMIFWNETNITWCGFRSGGLRDSAENLQIFLNKKKKWNNIEVCTCYVQRGLRDSAENLQIFLNKKKKRKNIEVCTCYVQTCQTGFLVK